jgi:hypothetical protein
LSTHGKERKEKRGGRGRGGCKLQDPQRQCSNQSFHPKSTLKNGSFTDNNNNNNNNNNNIIIIIKRKFI